MAQDVQMMWIEDDIKKIQTKTNLYIQQYGPEGSFHLGREVVQNGIDECEDEQSPGNIVEINYDKQTDILTVEDDGRGFPETNYPLDVFCTKIQSGSKFFRDQSGNTSGEFGLGLTAVCALSEYFRITSYRKKEQYKHTLEFKEGEKILDVKDTLDTGDKQHGCIVQFKASKKYLGSNTHLPYEEMIEWIKLLMYQMNRNSKLKVKIEIYDGFKLVTSELCKPKPFSELLDTVCPDNKYSSKMSFHGRNDKAFDEELSIVNPKTGKVTKKKVHRYLDISVALRYVEDAATVYNSYCNYTTTSEGGVHNDTIEACYCRYMVTKVRETMTDAQKEKMKILWEDVKNGLYCVINLSTDAQVGFVGNAKQKVGNKALAPYITEIVNTGINSFFNENPSVLNEYVRIIKLNAKARIEMQRVKTATQKERMNSFAEHEMKNFIRCNNTGKKFKEIFLVEGDSPSGTAANGCDKDTQAFFMFRGNTLNPLKCTIADVMENREWRDYVKVLRCGIGDNCDPSKLYFDRINLMTDSDIDGYGISSGMLVFHYVYLRPLIETGHVYKVFSPLYHLDDKKNDFVVKKSEITEIFHKKIQKQYKMSYPNGIKMTKDDVFEFLTDTYDYKETLDSAARNSGRINNIFVEIITALLVISGKLKSSRNVDENLSTIYDALENQKFVTELMSRIQEKFPEMLYHGNGQFTGAIDSKLCSLKISRPFIRRIEDLIPKYEKYGYKFIIYDKNGNETVMTIREFFGVCEKLIPGILTRYKGLGELDADEIWKTTLDINNRVSVQYTIEDAERDMAIFRKLHGSSSADKKARKEMMSKYKIAREDLDN